MSTVPNTDANELTGAPEERSDAQEVALSDERVRRLLVVDDDEGVRDFIQSVYSSTNVKCSCAASGGLAHEILAADPNGFDAILLDVSMPEETGWEFLARLREEGNATPVLFLSGHRGVESRVRGLELGADDYIVKPFDAKELRARVAAVVRRANALPTLSIGQLHIDPANRIVLCGEDRVELSPREFDLLYGLSRARGQVLSKSELLTQIWGTNDDPGTKVVEVHISRLRAKLERFGSDMIETVLGRGYRIRATEEG